MIDEQRRFHKVIFDEKVGMAYSCGVIIESKSKGIIMYTSNGHYRFDENNNKWQHFEWSTREQFKIGWRDNARFTDEQYIQTGTDKLIILDYAQQKKSFEFVLPNIISTCRINDDELLAAVYKGKLARISISQNKIIKEYPLTIMENGRLVNTNVVHLRQAANGQAIVSTGLGGLFIFDPATETLTRYIHNPLDAESLSENGKGNISCDAAGNVFISGGTGGLDYFNISHYSPVHLSFFMDRDKNMYDGGFNCIEQDKKGVLWLGGKDCLVKYNPVTTRSTFFRYYYPIQNIGERPLEINAVCIDSKNRVWVGSNGGGLGLLNEVTGKLLRFSADSLDGHPPLLHSNFVFDIEEGNGDTLWIGTSTGVYMLNTATHKVDSLPGGIPVSNGVDKAVVKIFKDSRQNIWIGTFVNGLYCFANNTGTLKEFLFPDKKKLIRVSSFAEDPAGRIFVTASGGVCEIDSERDEVKYAVKNETAGAGNGSLVKAGDGRIWFSNNLSLSVFNTRNGEVNTSDEILRANLIGFTAGISASYDSVQYWAVNKGLIYFNSGKLKAGSDFPPPLVFAAGTADSIYEFTGNGSLTLSGKTNTVSFSFRAIDLYANKSIQYQYRLDGVDKDWINSNDNWQVKYNSLLPGVYTFSVRASKDGRNWSANSNAVRLIIHPAFWQTWWFKSLAIFFIVGLAYYFFRRRIAAIKEREKIKSEYEKKIAEVEMSSLRAQMNPHFMFNSLNSINNFILKNDPENASGYLTKFSRLMRLILDNSRSEWVPLEDEIKALELYIELEALRFENNFSYAVEITKDVDMVTTMIPPMIIQPYVENAIWHGLLHRKEPGARLEIHIWKNAETINIQIEDNGIGRKEAQKRKSKSAIKQKSHGMEITAQRLDIVNQLYNVNAKVTVTDLHGIDGIVSGTNVLLNLNYKKNDSHTS